MTYRFVAFALEHHGHLESKVDRRLAEMAQAGVRSVVLLGATMVARMVVDPAPSRQIQVAGVPAEMESGEQFCGVPLLREEELTRDLPWGPSWVEALHPAVLPVTAMDESQAVEAVLHRLALSAERVRHLA
ncbi:MAG: hypothetical protein AB1505_27575 [Candidatus Latescibacterota bacterium]